jgi:hypothetical protein
MCELDGVWWVGCIYYIKQRQCLVLFGLRLRWFARYTRVVLCILKAEDSKGRSDISHHCSFLQDKRESHHFMQLPHSNATQCTPPIYLNSYQMENPSIPEIQMRTCKVVY